MIGILQWRMKPYIIPIFINGIKTKRMSNPLPPDIVGDIINILTYAFAGLVGWVSRWLATKKADTKK